MSMCKLHSEFYRQQAKLDALLTRRCHTITEGKNGEGATYIKTARGWPHIAHGVRNTVEGLRYVIYLFVTDLKEPWKVIAEPAGFLIAPRGWERVSDVSNVYLPMVLLRMMTVRCIFIMPPAIRACTLLPRPLASFWTLHSKTPQTLGLPLPGDYGQVPAKLWYLHKV